MYISRVMLGWTLLVPLDGPWRRGRRALNRPQKTSASPIALGILDVDIIGLRILNVALVQCSVSNIMRMLRNN